MSYTSKTLVVFAGVMALFLLVGCDESSDSNATGDSFSGISNFAMDADALSNVNTWDSGNSDLPSAYTDDVSGPAAHCPEPTTLALFLCGAGVATCLRRWRKRSTSG